MDISWKEVFGLTVSPLELMIRGTLVYLFLIFVFRTVLQRDIGAVGAYGMPMRFNVAEGMMTITVAGAPYSFESYKARTRSVYVNKNLIGMYRGVGMPLACVVTELLTDAAAHESADLVTIRAVRIQLGVLVAAQAFLKPGGRLALFRGPGEEPPPLVPSLTLEADEPLVETLRSRLLILRKSR